MKVPQIFYLLLVCMYMMGEGTCYRTHVEATGQFMDIFSLYYVGSEDQTQATRLDGNIFTH